jgi:hypothetical protein
MRKLHEVLLENLDVTRQIVSELNSWNGCLDHLEAYENDEYFFDTFFDGRPAEAVRATFYGDYRYMDEYVRFNGYGNLESLSGYDVEQELKDNIEEIVNNMFEYRHNISLDPDIEALMDEDVSEVLDQIES